MCSSDLFPSHDKRNSSGIMNGAMYISMNWQRYAFGALAGPTAGSNDMLKGLETGTTARTRIGNKVKAQYLKGAFTFGAALCAPMDAAGATNKGGQGGESMIGGAAAGTQYLRTSYRFMIVKDMQVNSTDAQVRWDQVMDTTGTQAGIHSELNVDNMGRFVVLEDRRFTVDADSPQKTVPFKINGSRIGSVRYNGPSVTALTNSGVCVVFAAYVFGYDSVAANITLPSPVGNSRLCFTDE